MPTLLMAQVKQWLAMAAFLASIDHIGSLKHKATKICVSNISNIFLGGKKKKVHILLPERSHCSWGVEDNLSSMHAVHEPVKWVVAAITDIHSYLSKLCLKDSVASVALHIVCRLFWWSRKHIRFANDNGIKW